MNFILDCLWVALYVYLGIFFLHLSAYLLIGVLVLLDTICNAISSGLNKFRK